MSKKSWFVLLVLFVYLSTCVGCGTLPRRLDVSTYRIRGIAYLPLVPICEKKGMRWDYDTFTRTMTVQDAGHKVQLMVGEKMVIVDAGVLYLEHPVEMKEGTVMVPYEFNRDILERLFKKTQPIPLPAVTSLKIKKVVIDAGHGGKDPGAIGRNGLQEKEVTLDIANRVHNLLQSYGIESVMVRRSDVFVELKDRAAIANTSGADLFVSIHANANRARWVNGFEIYYASDTIDDTQRALNIAKTSRLPFAESCLASPSSTLKTIIWDLVYTNNRIESVNVARSICATIRRNVDVRIIGIKQARFHVLKYTNIPAILVEVGFLSNVTEEGLLRSTYYRQKIAESIAEGIRYAAQSVI